MVLLHVLVLDNCCANQSCIIQYNTRTCTGTFNKAGDTPLSLACANGHLDTVKYLVKEHHCDPRSKHALYVPSIAPSFSTTLVHVQVHSIRLVTLHSLWPVPMATWVWLCISPSLITVIQKVNSSVLTCWL